MTGSGGASLHASGWGWRHAGRSAWALRGIDLHIDPGERVLIAGPSGSGKSTLLRGLAGVLGSDDEGQSEGELRVDGVPADQARGRVGLVLQDPDTQIVLERVGDDVAFGCENRGVPRDDIWERVHESLDAVGLRVPLEQSTQRLSGGQKQRLALASALAMRPGAIVLYEPTANLDPAGARSVRDAVARVVAETGATLVVVEHRVDLWVDLVDRVIVLDSDGGISHDGQPETVFVEHVRELVDAGVWVPGRPPVVPSRALAGEQDALLTARSLAVGRPRGPIVRDGIDLTISSGRITAVTGPNGVGKTTLAFTLAGLLPPQRGQVTASDALSAGAALTPHRWSSRQLLTRIGMVFQEPEHQFLSARVRDEIGIGLRALKMPASERERRTDEMLGALGLDSLADANPFTLSGGQKRRLSVATVLATQPRVIVLDEPTFGQDRNGWENLCALVATAADAGSAIVAVSHDEYFVSAVADESWHLDDRAVVTAS